MNNYISQTKQLLNQLVEIECIPVESDYSIINHEKFSLDKLMTTGLNLSALIPTIKETKELKQTGTTLYKMVPPKGIIKGSLQSNNGITFGHFVNKKGLITNRASFESVAKTTATVNPYAILITAAVSVVTKKLDSIKDKQIEILEFVKIQEEAKIKANVKVLQEISEQLQYNIDNDLYKSTKVLEISRIKADSEASIISCKKQIQSIASKTNLFHFDKDIKNKTAELEKIFQNYQLSLYQFSYSSFLEVVLYENFDRGYLNLVHDKVINYIDDFRKIHDECYDKLLSDSKTSIESTAIKGFAGMTKGIGKAVQKISLTLTGEDENNLLEFSNKVKDYNNQRIESKMDSFSKDQESCSLVFADNIKTINTLFNNELEILFDDENLYVTATINN